MALAMSSAYFLVMIFLLCSPSSLLTSVPPLTIPRLPPRELGPDTSTSSSLAVATLCVLEFDAVGVVNLVLHCGQVLPSLANDRVQDLVGDIGTDLEHLAGATLDGLPAGFGLRLDLPVLPLGHKVGE